MAQTECFRGKARVFWGCGAGGLLPVLFGFALSRARSVLSFRSGGEGKGRVHVHYRHDPRSYVKPYGSATELRSKKETGSPKASRLTRTIPSTTLHGASLYVSTTRLLARRPAAGLPVRPAVSTSQNRKYLPDFPWNMCSPDRHHSRRSDTTGSRDSRNQDPTQAFSPALFNE